MKFEDLFTVYEPPPGGLDDLRRRLASLPARRRRTVMLRGAGAALTAAAAILLAILLWSPWSEDPFSRSLSRLAEETLRGEDGAAVSLPPHARYDTAVMRVPTGREEVSFYWVVKIDHPDGPAAE